MRTVPSISQFLTTYQRGKGVGGWGGYFLNSSINTLNSLSAFLYTTTCHELDGIQGKSA